ncbi:beta-lactamase [Nannizzia gypsea CBS 118893]|uniref:Beta-lactamase n=1 Tax=Arthroderma gypseum (strain ATCC MYA-4604 / CBS 118893) TaxID=535722 RepID=E4V3B9_ARTGP|nr:beta-lactamase [Nannizzia gypsea CBS 118893]EFR04493.1 beta-lactamase [Nannizzia gypsea CBS 118893]
MVKILYAVTSLLLLNPTLCLCDSQNYQAVEKIRADFRLPGFAAGLFKNGHLQYEVTGRRKSTEPIPIKRNDKFHLGSNTKAMTGTLIGMMVDRGLISWTSTLQEVLPDFAHIMHDDHRNTTIAMLGAHRSGIFDDYSKDVDFYLGLYNLDPVEGRKAMINHTLSKEPGTTRGQYAYDNTNYVILGRIIENFLGVKNGASWEQIITSELFNPLGMKCGFGTPPQSSETSIDNPWGHFFYNSSSNPEPLGGPLVRRDNPPAIGPAGTVHCDIKSYMSFPKLHIDGFNGRRTKLGISKKTFKMLHTPYPSTDGVQYTPGGWIYANGSTTPWTNGPTLGHEGSNRSNYALVFLVPKRGPTGEIITGFANTGNYILEEGTAPAAEAMYTAVLDIMEGRLFK